MNILLIIIIVLTIIVSFKGFEDNSFFRKFEFHIGSIRSGEQFRIISSAFLHADISHLAFNMLTLYFFAPVIYGFLGNISFGLIYLGRILSSNPLLKSSIVLF